MDINKLLKQAQSMQQQMAEMQEEAAHKEYEGKAGGGLVTILLSGKSEMKEVGIDPSLLLESEKAILEDLIKAAYNDAKAKLESDSKDSMSGMMGSLGLPPGFKPPF